MAQFPQVEIDHSQTMQAASAAANDALMFVMLRGKFPQGVPPDIARLSIGTGATAVTLAVSPAQGVYIRNVSASASVQVTWTPTGGSSAVIQDLAPGAWIAFAQPGSGAAVVTATPGISALTLQASAAATPVEVTLVG